MDGKIEIINASIGSSNYDILIGNEILSSLVNEEKILSRDNAVFVISSRVFSLHKDYINNIINTIKGSVILIMDDAEENKSYKYAEKFLNELIEKSISRKSIIIGIGGGVVGDFAGYLAALYMRGIPIIHVPTTLLAMVDSSIGGKVAVNLSLGKNIVGAFHQPVSVVSDINFLNTLPDNELKNGLTEALKHGLIGEKTTLEIFEKNDLESIKRDAVISDIISLSARFKTSVVEKDETEGGLRAILNFGHTVGHAIESLLEYQKISHGEAVAVGIKVEMEISKRMGWLSDEDVVNMNSLMDKYHLIEKSLDLDPEKVISHMKYDKKNSSGNINFVLLKGIGNPLFNQQVDENILRDALKDNVC